MRKFLAELIGYHNREPEALPPKDPPSALVEEAREARRVRDEALAKVARLENHLLALQEIIEARRDAEVIKPGTTVSLNMPGTSGLEEKVWVMITEAILRKDGPVEYGVLWFQGGEVRTARLASSFVEPEDEGLPIQRIDFTK